MAIELRLADLRKGWDWIYGAEYYTGGDLAGYIQGEVEIYVEEQPYSAEFLFRVCDDENGKPNTLLSFSNPPTEKQKSRVDEIFSQLENKLTDLSNKCKLADIIGLEIPDDISLLEITEDEAYHPAEYDLRINSDTSYNLDRWEISEAINEYCTEEAAMERDISMRRAWGYYD